MNLHKQLSVRLDKRPGESHLGVGREKITLLRVISTMTFIHFVTGKSSGILSDIFSGIRSGILSGISSGILPGIVDVAIRSVALQEKLL